MALVHIVKRRHAIGHARASIDTWGERAQVV